jgi:outer membrane protein OmpA-like peptidoglycan-associated protein
MSIDDESGSGSQDAHWIPLSDLMTGLMVMFLLIAVVYMMRIEAETARIKEVAIAYNEVRDELHRDLVREFESDLPRWKAKIVKADLAVQFTEPEVLFGSGSSAIRAEFGMILDDFFPRYLQILTSDKYRESITEVRIEGHTSSEWYNGATDRLAYFQNMALSQERTRSTLQYVMSLPRSAPHEAWLRQHLTANGLSSSRVVNDANGREDRSRSRRVEFKVRTDAETRIAKILEVSSQ